MAEKRSTLPIDPAPRDPVAARRRRWQSALPVGLLAMLTLVYSGCSEATRYKTLSFFFDGVPPPPGMETDQPKKVVGPWGIPVDPNAPELPRELAPRPPAPQPTEPELVFYHAAYRQRQCSACHAAERGYEVTSGGAEFCFKCHADTFPSRRGDWVHGPVARGQCLYCHRPHDASNRHLLAEIQPGLCWRCHETERVLAQPYHKTADTEKCSSCHDPHFAGNRLLLNDSATYERRRAAALPAPAHVGWDREQCERCHLPERSNALIENVDAICLECHTSVTERGTGGRLHMPVRQGQCTLCHTPHQSSRPHLVTPEAEKLCTVCHDIDDIRTREHPPVTRADCLLCHRGHSAERPQLLRLGIPLHGEKGHDRPEPHATPAEGEHNGP